MGRAGFHWSCIPKGIIISLLFQGQSDQSLKYLSSIQVVRVYFGMAELIRALNEITLLKSLTMAL